MLIGLILIATGLLSGWVNSIAGGGALISLPVVILIIGTNVTAIGTNKIGGTIASIVGLAVYAWHGHVDWRKGIVFSIVTALSGVLGAHAAPYIPGWVFPWLLAVTCPIILYVVWHKDLWAAHADGPLEHYTVSRWLAFITLGVACGFYDGVWGPGSGTFMFLSLLLVARLPLLTALALSKLADLASGGSAMIVYVLAGHAQWREGLLLGLGMIGGAYAGAQLARKQSSTIIRPVLVVVVALLIGKIFYDRTHRPHTPVAVHTAAISSVSDSSAKHY